MQSKIEKYDLGPEIIDLYENKNYGYEKVANMISAKYSDIPELADISHMAIKRHIEKTKEISMTKDLYNQVNIDKKFESEYDKQLQELIDDTQTLKTMAIGEIEKAQKENNYTYSDISKLFRSYKESLEQLRRGLITLREFKTRDYDKPREKITIKQEIKIQNFFTELIPDLCDRCQNKVNKKVAELLQP